MAKKKSLAAFKENFGKLIGKEVEVLETHERYGEKLSEGEKGTVRSGGGFGLYEKKIEVPVYFPDRKEIIGVEYEKLCLARNEVDEAEHRGHKGHKSHKNT